MINEGKIIRLRGRLLEEYLEPSGGDSPNSRARLVADALEWARAAEAKVPPGWNRNPDYAARWNVNVILDGSRGVQSQFIDFWTGFLDARNLIVDEPGFLEPAAERADDVRLTDAEIERIADLVAARLARRLTDAR